MGKYENAEVGDTTNNFCQQHDHAAVLILLNQFYFEPFLSHMMLVYIYIYIYTFIIKLAIFILFLHA